MPQGFGSQYNIILQRTDPAIALLGNLLHLDLNLPPIDSPVAALQRTFIGKFVPLEVFRVNMTALTPERLCSYLTLLNPGKYLQSHMHASVGDRRRGVRAACSLIAPFNRIEQVWCANAACRDQVL